MMKNVIAITFVLYSTLTASQSQLSAAIVGVTGTTSPGFNPDSALVVHQDLVSIQRNGGTSTDLIGSSSVVVTDIAAGAIFHSLNEPTPGNSNVALSGLGFSTGRTNVGATDFALPTALNSGDPRFIFFGELGALNQLGNGVTVMPLLNGSPIAGWTLAITAADYGEESEAFRTNVNDVDNSVRLTSFELTDFTGGIGILTNVNGIRLLDDNGIVNFDPVLLGTASKVPEPSCLAMLAIGLATIAWRLNIDRK